MLRSNYQHSYHEHVIFRPNPSRNHRLDRRAASANVSHTTVLICSSPNTAHPARSTSNTNVPEYPEINSLSVSQGGEGYPLHFTIDYLA